MDKGEVIIDEDPLLLLRRLFVRVENWVNTVGIMTGGVVEEENEKALVSEICVGFDGDNVRCCCCKISIPCWAPFADASLLGDRTANVVLDHSTVGDWNDSTVIAVVIAFPVG